MLCNIGSYTAYIKILALLLAMQLGARYYYTLLCFSFIFKRQITYLKGLL